MAPHLGFDFSQRLEVFFPSFGQLSLVFLDHHHHFLSVFSLYTAYLVLRLITVVYHLYLCHLHAVESP